MSGRHRRFREDFFRYAWQMPGTRAAYPVIEVLPCGQPRQTECLQGTVSITGYIEAQPRCARQHAPASLNSPLSTNQGPTP